jgi:sterol desaturase/sphingolipid hydroxylase (fatty acid hydroxylase superfamily)
LGLLNFEHSVASHRADIALYGAAVLALAAGAWATAPAGQLIAVCAWALIGLAAWTLVEYLLHRFVLHQVPPFKRLHALHHQRPTALIGSPTLMTAALFSLLVFAPSLTTVGLPRACALSLGMVGGYLAYTLVHDGVHQSGGGGTSWPWLQRRKRWHGLHHCRQAKPACFGVTSGFWDHVFGTVGEPAPLVPLR